MTFVCMNMDRSPIIIFMEFKEYTPVHRMERHCVILFGTDSFFKSSKIGILGKTIVGVY